VKAAFLFHRKQGKSVHEHPRKDAHTRFCGHAFFVIDLDSFHSARRRVAFENKTAEILGRKPGNALFRPGNHHFRFVDPGAAGDEPGRVRVPFEPHGFARNAHAAFGFRTDRRIIHIPSQRVAQEAVELVPSVIADVFSQKTGADAQFDLFHDASLPQPRAFCRLVTGDRCERPASPSPIS